MDLENSTFTGSLTGQGKAVGYLPDDIVWIDGGTADRRLSKGTNIAKGYKRIGGCGELWSYTS